MEDLLLRQLEARKQRRPYAVATIVEATGSTPRTEGRMLVYADGSSIGTIGGETPEELAIAILAQILLVKNRGRAALRTETEEKA